MCSLNASLRLSEHLRAALTPPRVASGSIEQRVMLLRRGLTERVPRVRTAATSMLRTWLVGECDANITALLRALDVETHEGAEHAQLMCKLVVRR